MTARRVALVGAECTGKSTLSKALATRFNAGLVAEYLREWCATHGRTPRVHEQAHIAATQAARIEAAARTHDLVICDTTPLVTALFSEHYFSDDSLTAEALAFQRSCGLTLVCAPDLAWEADGFLRDGPQVRASVDARLRGLLNRAGLPYANVQGPWPERHEQAHDALAAFLQA